MQTEELLLKCVELAKEKKAEEILSLEIKNLTVVAEYFLLMTVKNNRQAQAMADYLEEETEKIGYGPLRTEGYQEGVWVLLDYGSLIVHIFQDAERKYYNLERLWGDAPQVVY